MGISPHNLPVSSPRLIRSIRSALSARFDELVASVASAPSAPDDMSRWLALFPPSADDVKNDAGEAGTLPCSASSLSRGRPGCELSSSASAIGSSGSRRAAASWTSRCHIAVRRALSIPAPPYEGPRPEPELEAAGRGSGASTSMCASKSNSPPEMEDSRDGAEVRSTGLTLDTALASPSAAGAAAATAPSTCLAAQRLPFVHSGGRSAHSGTAEGAKVKPNSGLPSSLSNPVRSASRRASLSRCLRRAAVPTLVDRWPRPDAEAGGEAGRAGIGYGTAWARSCSRIDIGVCEWALPPGGTGRLASRSRRIRGGLNVGFGLRCGWGEVSKANMLNGRGGGTVACGDAGWEDRDERDGLDPIGAESMGWSKMP
jgi:hypothetical protein